MGVTRMIACRAQRLRQSNSWARWLTRLPSEPFAAWTGVEPHVCTNFYKYTDLPELTPLKEQLIDLWGSAGVLGRVYLAQEGVNAQMSVPESQWEHFERSTKALLLMLHDVPVPRGAIIPRESVEPPFRKLHVRVRPHLVFDGLEEPLDLTRAGSHAAPSVWHQRLASPQADAVVLDCRNGYESEIGRFEGAVPLDTHTFRETFDKLDEIVASRRANQSESGGGGEDMDYMLYCTGGIRCEKVGAYLVQQHGVDPSRVVQLEGGSNAYGEWLQKSVGLADSKFVGKNFQFDQRMVSNGALKLSNTVIAKCHQCGTDCDTHTNCKNDRCHLLFIQCGHCAAEMSGHCSPQCATPDSDDTSTPALYQWVSRGALQRPSTP